MEREQIQTMIEEIMVKDGPDGHTDGSGVITDFICALMDGKGIDWCKDYLNDQPTMQSNPFSKETTEKFLKLLDRYKK